MKKKLSLFMTFAMLFSACAGTVSATPKKNVITMTIPSSYGYVYDRLMETLLWVGASSNYYDYTEIPVEEVIEEEGIVEEAVVEEAVVTEAPAMEAAAPQTGGTGGASDDYSKTNTQVEGIDEGDIVKTDGEYIYVLKNDNSTYDYLVILSADGADTKVLSKTMIADYKNTLTYPDHYEKSRDDAQELYIYGDYAAVIREHDWSYEYRLNSNPDLDRDYILVDLYDISDPTAPKLVSTLGQEGGYNTSRLIDGTLYLLTEYTVSSYDLRQAAPENYDAYIPHLYKNGTTELIPVNSIVCPPEITNRTFTVFSAYDLNTREISATKSVITPTDTVYMSDEHLYLADEISYNDVLDEYTESVYTVRETVSGRRTTIYKLAFTDPKKITTKAVGTVDGTLLNQFAMDEHEGNLRVVTTHSSSSRKVYTDEKMGFTNTVWHSSDQTNGLYIFDENMDLTGSITGLAEDERVYSVRFTGDVGYFVTFRETDPLFAVDLSNPKNPKIMSALKIPGFSEYLHPYADGLLFGLGQDADAVRTYGMKLSMFDTSDPYDVVERNKLSLDINSSTALSNHKAILISASRGIIGFPYSSGYALYGYDTSKGFYEIARTKLDGKWNGSYSRGLYVGDMIYIVMQDRTVVMDMVNYDVVTTVKY